MRDRRRQQKSARSLKVGTNGNGHHSRQDAAVTETALNSPELFAAFEHATIGFSVTDLEGRVCDCNPAFCAITGYTASELRLERDPLTLTHPDDLARSVEQMLPLIAGKTPGVVIDKRYVRKTGDIVWVKSSLSLLRDDDGRPQKIVRITEDITERKRVEASLQEAMQRNEAILASVRDVHILFDKQWRYVYVNDAAVEAIGRSRAEVLGQTLWEMYPDILGTELEEQYRRAMEKQVTVTFPFHYRTTNTWWEYRFYPTPQGLAVFATDITERTRAVELLRQSEQEWADAQQLATLGSWSWDIKTGLMTWSDELFRILGLHPQEIQATFAAGIARVHPDDRERVLRSMDRCIETQERYSEPNRIIRPNGEVRTIHLVGSVVADEQGHPIRMFGLCHDITELEASKEAREAAERKYRQIIENAGEGIFQSTPEGSYLMANPALARMHGFNSPAELMRSCGDITHEIYVDPARRAEFKRVIDKRGVVRCSEYESFRKDGSKIWISVNARTVRDQSGRIQYYEGTAQDITERKRAEQALRESEERYRELFENSKDALYVHDMSGRYTSVNRAAEKLSGYTREELIGQHFSMFLNPEHERHVRKQLCKKLEAAGETTYEIEFLTKESRNVPVEVSSRLIFANGIAVGVQGCVRDVSERRRVQDAARTYSRRLIEAQEAERRRISRELHDQVGQILTAVKMNLHSLKQKCAGAEILSSIEDNMRAIDDAVDQVRDLSVDLRPLVLDDLGLVVALRWYLHRQSKSSGVQAEFNSNSLSENVRFPSELETACFRIVQEAVTNCVRHAKASRISVDLKTAGQNLLLWISDNGVGFDMSVLRNGAATLGLRGMEERVQALGGSLTIDSTPELGTEICARFPIAAPQGRNGSASPLHS